MPVAADELIAQACAQFGVTVVRDLKPGGQKSVHLVEGADGRQTVLKVVASRNSSPQTLMRAAREVDLLRSINSPHVVRVVSDLVVLTNAPATDPDDEVADEQDEGLVPETEGAAWLEEYLDGHDLSDLLGTRWDPRETAVLGLHVARGLVTMHASEITHRDLSPANIRKSSDGLYRVMDPGYARHGLLPPITHGGQPGTLGYLSPEHLLPPPLGPTAFSDVFCIGVLMYQALTCEQPIAYFGDDADYLGRLGRVEYEPLASVRQDLDDDLLAIVSRCLHRQSARRYRGADRLAEALEEYLSDSAD